MTTPPTDPNMQEEANCTPEIYTAYEEYRERSVAPSILEAFTRGYNAGQASVGNGWRPITETDKPPMDGTEFWAFSSTRGPRLDKASPTGRDLFWDQRRGEIYTHWMPTFLPQPTEVKP